MTTIVLSDDLAAQLGADAERAGQPLGRYVQDLLSDVVAADHWDDSADFEEFKRTREGIPGEDVVAWLKAGGPSSGLPFPKPRRIE